MYYTSDYLFVTLYFFFFFHYSTFFSRGSCLITSLLYTLSLILFIELRKIYFRVRIYKLVESLFNIFVIYSNLKLQINNSLKLF
jgi:hypothetical protein